jgi:hypothetical protein
VAVAGDADPANAVVAVRKHLTETIERTEIMMAIAAADQMSNSEGRTSANDGSLRSRAWRAETNAYAINW